MDSGELIDLFYNRTYEKFVNKQILDDKNFIVPRQQLINYVHELIDIPYIEFIDYIKKDNNDIIIEATDITQFSSFSACEIDMCNALIWANNPGCQFVDVGRLFPDNVSSRTDTAYRKYGENHIKAASQLGLTFEYYEYWYLSCIGYIYPDLEEDERKQLLARTITRNNLYRLMLVDIIGHDVYPEVYMNMLSENTMKRRMRNVINFFDICLEECAYNKIKTCRLYRRNANNKILNEGLSLSSTGTIASSIVKACYKFEYLTDEETKDLFEKVKKGDHDAYDKLVKSYLRLVVSLAKSFKDKGVEFDDLIQEGSMGLMKAIEYYNPNRFTSFGFYARWWIRQYLIQAVSSIPLIVKIPQNQLSLHNKVCKEIEKYEQKYEYTPSISEIEVDEDVDNISYISKLPENLSNLTTTKDDWEDYPNYDFIPDDGLEKEDKCNIINTALNGLLGEREIEIVKAVWGIDQEEQSLSKIAESFYLTRERVRQIAWKAVSKIKESSIYKKFLYTDGKLLGKQIEDGKEYKAQNSNIQEGTLLLSEVNDEFHNVGKSQRLEVNSSRKWDRDLYKLPPQNEEKKEPQEEKKSSGKSLDAKRKDGVQETKSLNVSDESSEKSIFTPDIIYSVFKNTTSTYKFYWFISILQLLQKTKESHLYIYDVLARMAANAWCPITCYNINFGSNDSFRQIVYALQKITKLPNYMNLELIYEGIQLKKDDENIKIELQKLIKYVPFRFLSPWIKASESQECVALSKEYKNDCLYALFTDNNNPYICINPSWEKFLREKNNELINFSYEELSRFLKDKNPNAKDIFKMINAHTSNSSSPVFNVCLDSHGTNSITITNKGRLCSLCDEKGVTLLSSSGKIIKCNSSYFRLVYTYSFFSTNLIVQNEYGLICLGERIINAKSNSELYNVLEKDIYHEQIEAIRYDDENNCYYIQVDNIWYNNSGVCVDSEARKANRPNSFELNTQNEVDIEEKTVVKKDLRIVAYNAGTIAIVGNTKPYKDELKSYGGYFVSSSPWGPVWVFREKKRNALQAYIDGTADISKDNRDGMAYKKASVSPAPQAPENMIDKIYSTPLIKTKVKVGDWIQWKPTRTVGKVVGFKRNGSLQKIVIRTKGGSEMEVYDNPKVYVFIHK